MQQTKINHTIFIFIDLSNAFDTITQETLLHKLVHCEKKGIVCDWFKNYFQDRIHFVKLDSVYSDTLNIEYGVGNSNLYE